MGKDDNPITMICDLFVAGYSKCKAYTLNFRITNKGFTQYH